VASVRFLASFAMLTALAASGCSERSAPTAPTAASTATVPARAALGNAPRSHVKAIGQLGPGRGTLVISIRPPNGGKLTVGAPLVVEASGEHLRFPRRVSTRLDPAALPLRLPIEVADGATGPAYVKLSYYWCGTGDEKACRPEKAELVVDLDTSGDAPGGEAHLDHRAAGS